MKNSFRSISEELFLLHDEIRYKWPSITRIAIALYDADTDLLHTFLQSNESANSLNHYSFPLADSASLSNIMQTKQPRYIENIQSIKDHQSKHSVFVSQNFKSSYTFPLFLNDQFLGFIFYDAIKAAYFTDDTIQDLKVYSKLIESMIHAEILPIKLLVSMFNVMHQITHTRDSETANHLLRMSHYMELLAAEMSEEFGFSDEEVEYIWLYAPMHDIGKMVIPDHILQKPGRLNAEERAIIETHVEEGLKIIDRILQQLNFRPLYHVDLLNNIIGCHHERWNGSGYPKGLKNEEIPAIGRIAAVADVFDALTAKRVYRDAMPVDEAFKYLQDNAGILFDPKAIKAFLKLKPQVITIHEKHADD